VISGKGGIKRFKKSREMSLMQNMDGYLTAKLSKNSVSKRIPVHRLVAEAFIENPYDLEEVNHKDYNRANNTVDNLEWISHGDNVRYSIAAGRHFCTRDLRGENNPNYNNGDALRRTYAEHPEMKQKCGLPGKVNPRATPVRLFDSKRKFIADFDYFGECADYLINNGFTKSNLESVRWRISERSRNGKLYANHYFELI